MIIQDIWMMHGRDMGKASDTPVPWKPGLSGEHAYWQSGLNIQGTPVGRFSYHPESHHLHQTPRTFPLLWNTPLSSPRALFMNPPSAVCPSFFFFFLSLVIYWPNHETRGILVPRPGIKPVPPTVEVRSLNHCSTREVPLPFLTPSPRLPSGLLQASFKCLKLLRVS